MAVFSTQEYDYGRFDFNTIISGGLATVAQHEQSKHLAWLTRHGYEVTSLDCTLGIKEMVRTFGRLFSWEENFGYSIENGSVNLSALSDGFGFSVSETGGMCWN